MAAFVQELCEKAELNIWIVAGFPALPGASATSLLHTIEMSSAGLLLHRMSTEPV